MALQMGLHLPLGLHHKSEADAVTGQPRNCANRKSPAVPEWHQVTDSAAELVQTLARPGEVIQFFLRCVGKMGLQQWIAAGQRLRLIERLRAHLAHVVDAHQGSGFM